METLNEPISGNSKLSSALPVVMSGSQTFMQTLEAVSKQASDRFYVQTMTFEGDSAGQQLIGLMLASRVKHKVLVIDSYSDVVLNDRFVQVPPGLLDRELQNEKKATQQLLKHAIAHGIHVYKTSPMGFLNHRYPFRNHKKCVVVDHHLFTGGINFSDHNFAWHDMMIRVPSKVLSDAAAEDILANAEGIQTSGVIQDGKTTLLYLNRKSSAEYRYVMDWICSAKQHIQVYSPYVSDPLVSVLRSISHNVEISFFVPAVNNKDLFRQYMRRKCSEGWFSLYEIPQQMSHLKAICMDDEQLLFGSSNFDFISYLFEDEISVISSETEVLEAFRSQIRDPFLKTAQKVTHAVHNSISSHIPDLIWSLLRYIDSKPSSIYLRS
jgi:cardiolipin synthase A/B